jgi:hypothetical protein
MIQQYYYEYVLRLEFDKQTIENWEANENDRIKKKAPSIVIWGGVIHAIDGRGPYWSMDRLNKKPKLDLQPKLAPSNHSMDTDHVVVIKKNRLCDSDQLCIKSLDARVCAMRV